MEEKENKMTRWNIARILLEYIPESSLTMARAASVILDMAEVDDGLPSVESREIQQGELGEWRDNPYYRSLHRNIGTAFLADFGAYNIIEEMFNPIFKEALSAENIDDDLMRRCCLFLEAALTGEPIVSESIDMMLIENFSKESAFRVSRYAGPLFLDSLRHEGLIDG